MARLTEITLKELPELLQIFDKSKKSVFIEGTHLVLQKHN